MFDHVFTYRTEIPEGLGWQHFGPVHLTYLIGFAIATVVMVSVYRQADLDRRRKISLAYVCIVVIMEAIKQLLCLFTGVYEPGLVPLHLCGMSIFIMAIHHFKPNKWTAALLYALSLRGALAALLFGDWTMYPVLNFYCQQSFFIHFFEFSYPVLLLAAGDLHPRLGDLWRPALYCLAVVPPVYIFNKAFGTNFFFINDAAPGSPLSFLEDLLGNPGYLIGFAGLVAIVWVLMYLPWTISDARKKHRDED
jgi:hypothetical integral membrane protein (TIGR02206 family)